MATRDSTAYVNGGQGAPNGVNPYSGAGGKARSSRASSKKRKPYDRPVSAPSSGHQSASAVSSTGLVDSATRLISSSAFYLFSSIFKRSKTLTVANGGRPSVSAASDAGKSERKQDHPEAAAATGNNYRSVNVKSGNHAKSPKLAPKNGESHGKDLDLAQVEGLLKHKHWSRDQVERLTEVLQARLDEENAAKSLAQNGESSKGVAYQLNPVDLARAYMEEQTGKTVQSPSVLATPSQYLVAPSTVSGSRVLVDAYAPTSRMSATPATVACSSRISKRRYNAEEDDDLSSLRMAKRRLIAYEDDDIVFRGPPRRVRQKMAMVMRSPYLRQVNAMSRSSRASLTPMIQSKRPVEMSHEIMETPVQSMKGKTLDDSEVTLAICSQAEAPESSKSRDIVQKLENTKEDTHLAIEFPVASEAPVAKPAAPAEEKTSHAAVVPPESNFKTNSKSEVELPKQTAPAKSKGFRMSAIFEDSYSDDEQELENVPAVQVKELKSTVTTEINKQDSVPPLHIPTKPISQGANPDLKLPLKVEQNSMYEPHTVQSEHAFAFSTVEKTDSNATENRTALSRDTSVPLSTPLFSSISNGTALPPLPKPSSPVNSVFPAFHPQANEKLDKQPSHVVKVDTASTTMFTEATAATQTSLGNFLTADAPVVTVPEPVLAPVSTPAPSPAPVMLFNAAPIENKTEHVIVEPDSMAMETMAEDPASSNVTSSVSAFAFGSGPTAGSTTTNAASLAVAPSESSAQAAFTFGGQPSTTPATQPFTFGNSAPATQSAFTFGSSDSKPAESATKPSFAFGSSGSSEQPTSSASPSPFTFGSSALAPATPVPSFGSNTAAATSQPAFTFSASPAPSGAAPFAFGSSAGTTSSSQTFNFGGQPSSTPSNPFGAQPNSAAASPFGGQPTSTTPSPFGAQPTSTSASPFGAQPTQTATSPFGAQPTPTAANLFGAQPSSTVASPFGAQPAPAPASPFGGQPTPAPANPFGGQSAPAASTPFGGQPASNPAQSTFTFGGQPTAPSPSPAPSTFAFGGQPAASPAPFAFGGPSAAPSFGFGGQPAPAPPSPAQPAFAPPAAPASDFAGGFALGAASGGGDKAGRKFIKAKRVGAAKRK